MTGTSYTVWDKHNNLGFALDSNTAFTPGVLLTTSNVFSGTTLPLPSTAGLFSEAGGSGVSGLNIPGGAQVVSISGSNIDISAPVTGTVPTSTPLSFTNPVHLLVKSRDPKNLGSFYVEFLINNIGFGLNTGVGVGIAEFGAPPLPIADQAPLAAVYFSDHKVYVNGVLTSVGVIGANTFLDAPSGDQLNFGSDVVGITEGDSVSGFNIPPNTFVIAVDTNPLSITFGLVTLDKNITGPIPAGTPMTFTEIWSDGCVIGMAVDLGAKFIQFRKIGGAAGAVGNWSSPIDISALDINPSTLSRGVVLVAVNGSGNGGMSVTLLSDPADYNGRTGPMGYTLGWPDNEFSSGLGVVKATSYPMVGPPHLAVRKATGDALSGPPGEAVRKLTAHGISGPPGLAVRKLTAILFLFQIPTPWGPGVTTPPLYPGLVGLTFNVIKTPIWSTGVARAGSGRTVRVGYYSVNLWKFELVYSYLPDGPFNGTSPNDLKALEGFFLSPGVVGGWGGFRFTDIDDNAVVGERQGTTDGSSTNWIIGRQFSHSGGVWQIDSVFEPVGYVNVGEPINVYLDGVLQSPSTYDILTTTPVQQQLHFHAAPAGGKIITMDFAYWFYCRFADDSLDFIKFMNLLWQQDKIVLESLRG